MSDTVDTLINIADTHVHDVILMMRKDLLPTWIIIDHQNQPHIHTSPWKDDQEKTTAKRLLRFLIKIYYQAQAYSFVTEAWAANAPEDWEPNTPLLVEPRNNPERREIALAFATDGKQREFRCWNIRRDWNEQVIALEPVPRESEQIEGWMMELLQ